MDLSDFSPSQRDVIKAGDGPLSVLAGPGSGKTTVLAARIAYLVEVRGISPASILAITFTTAAAATLRARVAGVLGGAAHDLTITTFHALGLRLVKQWSHELGFGDRVPAVYGREDARTLLREAASGLGLEVAPESRDREPDPWALPISKLAFALDRYRLGWSPREGSSWDQEDLDEDLLRHLRHAYEGLLHERGAIDYPSMLTLPLRAFEAEPRALSFVQDAYRFVVIDEFQDTCDSQFRLLRQIVARHRNLSVVGDPNQAIYGWRGADPKLLLDFPREYPDAQVFPLDQNHRSTGVVVALSNVLAAPLEAGRESWTSNAPGPRARVYTARDELDEARFVATEIRRLLQAGEIHDAGEVAVLFRTNAQARTIALSLRAAALPARVRADLDLFAHAEVRDLVAYLRLAHAPSDGPALARVVNVPPRRLRAIEQALRKRPVPTAELPLWAQKRGGPTARQIVEELMAMLDDLHLNTSERRPVDVLEVVLQRTGYCEWLESQKDGLTRLRHVEELRSVMRSAQAPDLATWLADMHLGDVDSSTADAHAVVLATIHAAKGAEWPVVFLVGFEEGLIPHLRQGPADRLKRSEDDERRLAYVAFSRTQVLLYLVHCLNRRMPSAGEIGRVEPRRPSRFLVALPENLIEHVDHARLA